MSLRTDLAKEAFEYHTSRGGVSDGIKSESRSINKDIKVTKVEILTDEAAKRLDKQKGTYITINAEYIANRDSEQGENGIGCGPGKCKNDARRAWT